MYIYILIPQICFQHKGFLPSLKNCLKAPSAVACVRALLGPFPVARHPLPSLGVYCCFACVRALLGPFPVAMHPLPSLVVKCLRACFACVRALLGPFPVASHPLPPNGA